MLPLLPKSLLRCCCIQGEAEVRAQTQQTKGSLRQNCPETSIEPRPCFDVFMFLVSFGYIYIY